MQKTLFSPKRQDSCDKLYKSFINGQRFEDADGKSVRISECKVGDEVTLLSLGDGTRDRLGFLSSTVRVSFILEKKHGYSRNAR